MSNQNHPAAQVIGQIVVRTYDPINFTGESYEVGQDGVTRIEACTKCGSYADVPYVRIWKGETAFAEFCQHNIIGVYFKPEALKEEQPF
jgi:hypothetical protein